MKARTYLMISGLVFGLICLGHMLRIVFGWSLVIHTFDVPMAISWIAMALTAGLVVWVIRMLTREEHRNT